MELIFIIVMLIVVPYLIDVISNYQSDLHNLQWQIGELLMAQKNIEQMISCSTCYYANSEDIGPYEMEEACANCDVRREE